MIHHGKCPLCSSEEITIRFTCTDNFISRETFPVAGCNSCGFIFTQDYPEEGEISKYYESTDYISHSDTSEGFVNKVYHLVRQYMLRRKRRLVQKFTGLQTGRILDVGSGTGHFASEMKNGGWHASGIEINEKARAYSISSFGLDTVSPIEINTLEKGSFDCITLWHVLEHFYDPLKYLHDLIPLLKPDGIFVIALPNSSSFDAHSYGPFWAAFDVPRHIWHFSPETFGIFAEKAGLKVGCSRVLPFDVFYISILSEKYSGSGIALLSGLVKATFFSLKTIFNRNRSSSVIYILRKKGIE
jgi:SAM-dependent methyltransferase